MSNITILLIALGQIESGNNDRAIGKAGEVSRYQILPYVWKAYAKTSNISMSDATNEPRARIVATGVIKSIFRALERDKQSTDALHFYIAWNMGIPKFRRLGYQLERVPRSVLSRAERFVNLTKQ